jgi:hypothetical protein
MAALGSYGGGDGDVGDRRAKEREISKLFVFSVGDNVSTSSVKLKLCSIFT